jgi:hypothetical protein
MRQVIYIGNDNLIEADGLKDAAAAAVYLNVATLTATLQDANGAPVSGASNIALSYVANSNGKYQGNLEDTVVITDGTDYTLVLDAASGGLKGHWEIPCTARIRRS